MVTACLEALVREDFGKGIKEVLPLSSGCVFQTLKSNEVSKRKNPHLFIARVWRTV